MRVESLRDALAYFPDIDGFWSSEHLVELESRIRNQLPPNWESEPSALTAETLTQLARVQSLQGNLAEAQVTIDQTRKIIWGSGENFGARTQVRWKLEQGRIFCLSNNLRKANDIFVQAWEQANENGLIYFAIDAAFMLFTIRPPKLRLEWLQRALSLAESSTDSEARLWLSQLLYFEGWAAFDLRQFDKALNCFEKAQTQPQGMEWNHRGMALLWSRARVMRALGQVGQALESQEAILTEMTKTGTISGHVYLEIAECQQLLNLRSLAKSNFELAYNQLSTDTWFVDNRNDELNRMKYLFKKQ